INQIRLNASSISEFKACPQRFRLKNVCHIAPVEDADSLRMGSNWHKCFEVWEHAVTTWNLPPHETVCTVQEAAIQCVVDYLNVAYQKIPNGKTPLEWAAERAILCTSFCVYQAYYAEQQLEVVATEQKF